MRIDSIDIEERVEENRILTETMPKQQMTVNGKMRRMTQQIIEYLPWQNKQKVRMIYNNYDDASITQKEQE